jgi:hypothetical protein
LNSGDVLDSFLRRIEGSTNGQNTVAIANTSQEDGSVLEVELSLKNERKERLKTKKAPAVYRIIKNSSQQV